MVDACANCQDLYDRSEKDPQLCPRCSAVSELLLAADALRAKVKADLERPNKNLRVAVVVRSDLVPLIERTGRAIEKARAL